MAKSIRTDLAMEVKESFDEDHVEIQGVVLEKREEKENILVTTVVIETEEGARKMEKPMGTYVTIEDGRLMEENDEHQEAVMRILVKELKNMYRTSAKKRQVLVVGLGNREVTLDSLGPRVIDGLFVTRHLIRELGEGFAERNHLESVSGLAPGVMAQTGMETSEVIEGVCREIHPDLVIVVDALAAGSRDRLAASIQITNTGICPGSGVGNNRKVLNRDNLGADVIAIGVPMVMDMQEDRRFFVTPRNIDEAVVSIADCISESLNACFHSQEAGD